MAADPKPHKRIVDKDATPIKLGQDSTCRGCGQRATAGHHILLRSQGGDDVPDNIMPLCHPCHVAYHDGPHKSLRTTPAERAYVMERMGKVAGSDYLRRRYD